MGRCRLSRQEATRILETTGTLTLRSAAIVAEDDTGAIADTRAGSEAGPNLVAVIDDTPWAFTSCSVVRGGAVSRILSRAVARPEMTIPLEVLLPTPL